MIVNLENITTLIYLLRTIAISVCTYHTFLKITNIRRKNNILKNIAYYLFMVLICIVTTIVRNNTEPFTAVVSFAAMMILLCSTSTKSNIGYSIIATVISLAINYIVLTTCLIIMFILNLIIKTDNDMISLAFIVLFYVTILYTIFKMKKFKHGFSFLQGSTKDEYISITVLNISISVVIISILFSDRQIMISRNLIVYFVILLMAMIASIHKSLQLYYKQKLYEKDLNETKAKLEEKEKEVKELEAENLKISKNSHTLSHKQKSLEYKIEQMMTRAEISTEEVAEVRNRVKEIKKDLYKEKSAIKLDKTGIALIDDMLEYMQSECKKSKIDFELQIKGNIHYMTNNLITREDLETLLADHIKNAIIAINHTDNVNRSILVRLGEIDGIYSLYIYDSGIEFEKETLENLGKKPSTTHANEGGTGMGFMNTFDTLRKCKASLIINELNAPSKDNYTKAIIIKFDKKNEFQVISYR